MNNFRNRALQTEMQMNLILDSEDLSQPIIIRNKIELLLPMLSNQNGEADYNIWYHVKNTLSQNILIVGNDTDINFGFMVWHFLEVDNWVINK